MIARLRAWAKNLKREIVALWLAGRDPRVPWAAKLLAAFVAAYALSPIDLIPDFIPVLGWLDELILLPLGIALVVRMIPSEVMDDLRRRADALQARPRSRAGMLVIILIWTAAALAAAILVGRAVV